MKNGEATCSDCKEREDGHCARLHKYVARKKVVTSEKQTKILCGGFAWRQEATEHCVVGRKARRLRRRIKKAEAARRKGALDIMEDQR